MRYRFFALILLAILSIQCKKKEVKGEFTFKKKEVQKKEQASKIIDLKNKGIGPVTVRDQGTPWPSDRK